MDGVEEHIEIGSAFGSMDSGGVDKRGFYRFNAADWHVVLLKQRKGFFGLLSSRSACRIIDISAGGMQVHIKSAPLEKGKTYQFEMSCLNGGDCRKKIVVEGQVRRASKGDRYGIKFLNLPKDFFQVLSVSSIEHRMSGK